MTTVEINKVGTDYVELEMTQSGSHETNIDLRENLLDGSLNYHFCVTELNVPLSGTPLFPITTPQQLFRVVRRNVGSAARYATAAENPNDFIDPLPGVAQYSTYSITPEFPFFDVGDFCKDIGRWIRGFNYGVSLDGVDEDLHGGDGDIAPKNHGDASQDPYEFLRLSLTCDGSLELTGFPIFWNNYMFEFTSYGAALLGMDRNFLLTVGDRDFLAFTIDPAVTTHYSARTFLGNDLIIAGGVLQEVIVDTSSPIFETADQRVKVSVESHLPVSSNTQIINEKQSVNRDIVEIFFENEIETETKYDEQGNYAGISLLTKLYSGQHSLVRRSDRHNQWNRLTNSFELKFFRFFLYVTYRIWDGSKWNLQRQKMNIPKHSYWVMNIRFVSDV